MESSHLPSTPVDVDAAWPLSLRLTELASMLNLELSDHPVYDGCELQWFDDEVHGTGMLAFLSRRADRCLDYYQQRGLRLDRGGYRIGGGTGSWTECDFDVARLEVAPDGVAAEARFRDIDGRLVQLRVDDRDGHRRRPAPLLAPVSAGTERPTSLLLVWMPRFDLVRVTDAAPLIRIDGGDAAPGRLPGRRLHRRHLIKYAAPLLSLEVNREHRGPVEPVRTGQRSDVTAEGALTALVTEHGGHRARLVLDPGLPPPGAWSPQPDPSTQRGRWHVEVDGARLTGGTWSAARSASRARLVLDVDERWRPGPLPWLMRVVTTVVPVFRRWPTTYEWRCEVRLDGTEPTAASHWRRTGPAAVDSYRRATGS